jgi:ribosomal protein S24E
MKAVFFVILLAIPVLLMGLLYYHNVYAEELKVLESQLNKNSITGVIQNPYNYTIGSIQMRAEFYDKEDRHLVGLRDFYEVSRDELKPNEKSSFKIYEHAGNTTEFPKKDFVVKAEGIDYTNMKTVSGEEQIKGIEDLGKALRSLPNEVVVDVIDHKNGTQETVGKTITYENGTKEIINKTGTYKITSDENH